MRNILVPALVILATAVSASASTLTYTGSAGPLTATALGTTGSFNVPQYNGPETLLSVTLTVTGNSTGGANKVQNLDIAPGTVGSLTIGTDINVTGPAALVVLSLPQNSLTSVGVTANVNPPATYTGSDAAIVNGLSTTDTQSAFITSGLAPYIGAGNVSFNYTGSRNTAASIDFSPAIFGAVNPTFDFNYTVVYTTEATPEPASLSVLGLSGLGLLLRRRR